MALLEKRTPGAALSEEDLGFLLAALGVNVGAGRGETALWAQSRAFSVVRVVLECVFGGPYSVRCFRAFSVVHRVF